MNLAGELLEGRLEPENSEIVVMHSVVYHARAAVGGIIRTHSPAATAFALAHREPPCRAVPLLRIGQAEPVPVVPWGPRGSEVSVRGIAAVLAEHPTTSAALLANHGLLVFGSDPMAAARSRPRAGPWRSRSRRAARHRGAGLGDQDLHARPVTAPRGPRQRGRCARRAKPTWGARCLLGAAHRTQRRPWEARIADLGLTAPQAAVRRLVASGLGYGVRELARLLVTDPMNAQRIVEGLRAAGLCEAGRDLHDARRRPLRATARERRLAGEVTRQALASEADLVAILGDSSYHALLTALEPPRPTDGRGSPVPVNHAHPRPGVPAATTAAGQPGRPARTWSSQDRSCVPRSAPTCRATGLPSRKTVRVGMPWT